MHASPNGIITKDLPGDTLERWGRENKTEGEGRGGEKKAEEAGERGNNERCSTQAYKVAGT
jgi:hypothetical protein